MRYLTVDLTIALDPLNDDITDTDAALVAALVTKLEGDHLEVGPLSGPTGRYVIDAVEVRYP
jgi:hypothetical protein